MFTSRPARAAAVVVLLLLLRPSHPTTQPAAADVVFSLTITILSTMLADDGFGEWGFAALVDVDGKKILFDTGAHEDTVSRNLAALGLSLADVDTVVLSHNHDDHTTGWVPLQKQFASGRSLRTTYVGEGIFWPRIDAAGRVSDRMGQLRRDYESRGGRVVEVTKPVQLLPGVWLTGPVPRIHPERNWGALGKVRRQGEDVEDTVPEDMALVVRTSQGPVVLFGCGHAGVINTLDHVRTTIDPASVKAVIGGLHVYAASETTLSWTANELKRFGLQQLVGAHCTGIEAVFRIRELTGLTRQSCVVGAVGVTYSLADGLNARRIAR